MISKTNRFHGHSSLSNIYRRGQTVSYSQVSLKYLTIKPEKPRRVAVVVSRKVDKSAVVRNKIRRRIYEAIRIKLPNLTLNADIVVSVHNKQLATLKTAELDDLLSELLKRAGLIEG